MVYSWSPSPNTNPDGTESLVSKQSPPRSRLHILRVITHSKDMHQTELTLAAYSHGRANGGNAGRLFTSVTVDVADTLNVAQALTRPNPSAIRTLLSRSEWYLDTLAHAC